MKAGEVDLLRVPPVKLAELARYGMNAHAPTLRRLAEPRRRATVLATMRHLEGASVDDALTLFDVLMATNLLARAERAAVKEEMEGLPKLRKDAAKVRNAVTVFLDVPIEHQAEGGEESGAEPLSVAVAMAEAWQIVERIVTREELARAVVELGELLPEGSDEDADTAWRRLLIDRYVTARRFTSLLAEVIPRGVTEAGMPVIEALRELGKVQARRKPGVERIDTRLLEGSWKRLVLGDPLLAVNGIIDKKAWTFCVLEALHTALKRRDVYAKGADNWGDPRARLLSPDWQVNRPRVLTALELSGSADEHLGELEVLLDASTGTSPRTCPATRPSTSWTAGSGWRRSPSRPDTSRCTTRCRRCCRGSTIRSCCSKSTPGTACSTASSTSAARSPAPPTSTSPSPACWSTSPRTSVWSRSSSPEIRRRPARAQPWSAANICSRYFLASPLVSLIAAEDSCACVMSSFVIVAAIFWRRSSTVVTSLQGWWLPCDTERPTLVAASTLSPERGRFRDVQADSGA
ncbi:hypothetical protein ACWCPT_19920 [Streptomyces sp. NPDC002308]